MFHVESKLDFIGRYLNLNGDKQYKIPIYIGTFIYLILYKFTINFYSFIPIFLSITTISLYFFSFSNNKGVSRFSIYSLFLLFIVFYFTYFSQFVSLVYAATTTITGPAAASWQKTTFTVTVDDTVTCGTATYGIDDIDRSGIEVGSTSRTCPDGSFSITVSASGNCQTQGSNKCRGSANSSDSGAAGTDNRLFSIDYTAPLTTINSPANNTWQIPNVTFDVSDSDATSGLGACNYDVDDRNRTGLEVSNTTRTCNSATSFTLTIGDVLNCQTEGSLTCNVTVRANDVAGNVNQTQFRLLNIDHKAPYFSNNGTSKPSGIGYALNQNYGFQIQWNDSGRGVSQAIFEFNSVNYTKATSPALYNNTTAGIGVFYINLTDLAQGTYNYKWYANDSYDRWNSTSSLGFTVNRAATNTSLYLNSTEADKSYSRGVAANITATTNISTFTVTIYTNFTGSNTSRASGTGSIVNITNTSDLSAGKYAILANTTGNANYSASESVQRYLYVGHIVITPNSTTPRRGNFINISIDVRSFSPSSVNVSIVKPPAAVTTLTAALEANGTYFTNYTFAATDPPGSYMINVSANGNGIIQNSTNVTLNSTIIIPIDSVRRNSAGNLFVKTKTNLNINGTAFYANNNETLKSAALSFKRDNVNLTTNTTSSSTGFYEFNFVTDLEGRYNFSVTFTDTQNNSGTNFTTLVVADKPLNARYVLSYRLGSTKTNDVYRIATINQSVDNLNITRTYSPSSANFSKAYVCSYDEADFSGGLILAFIHSYRRTQVGFIEIDIQSFKNYTLALEQPIADSKLILAYTKTTCSLINDKMQLVEDQTIPSKALSSFTLGSPSEYPIQIRAGYDRIEINGTDRFGAGSHKVCIEKSGISVGGRPIVKVGRCVV